MIMYMEGLQSWTTLLHVLFDFEMTNSQYHYPHSVMHIVWPPLNKIKKHNSSLSQDESLLLSSLFCNSRMK